MKYILTEQKLQKLIRESIVSVLMESRGIQSKKLYDILSQYGGFGESPTKGVIDIHNLSDDDVITVMDNNDLRSIYNNKQYVVDHGKWADNYALDVWAKQQGVPLIKGDRVESIRLGDKKHSVIVICRNADQVRGREGEGFDGLWKKREQRRYDQNHDGKYRYIPQYVDALRSKLWKNPYKKQWSKDDRADIMNGIRQRYQLRKDGIIDPAVWQNY